MKSFRKILLLLALACTMAVCCVMTANAYFDGKNTYEQINDFYYGIVSADQNATGEFVIPSEVGRLNDKAVVSGIGVSAFNQRHNITSIVIPDSVKYIALYAFNTCNGLKQIVVDENNTQFSSEDGVLFNKDKTVLIRYPSAKEDASYTVPETVKTINAGAFENCKNLTSIVLGKNVDNIDTIAFKKASNLTSLTLGACTNVKHDENAFEDCTNLKNITITKDGNNNCMRVYSEDEDSDNYYKSSPWYMLRNNELHITVDSGITGVTDYSFKDCTGLKTLSISETVNSVADYALLNCENLEAINVNPNNKQLLSENGVLFNKNKTTLIQYPAAKKNTSFVIPDSVILLGKGAFYGCESLTDLTMPADVNYYGETFDGCTNLKNFTITKGTTGQLGDPVDVHIQKINYTYTPWYGKKNVNVKLCDGVISTGAESFYGCNINNIEIPGSVTHITYGTFHFATINNITIEEGVKYIGNSAFNSCRIKNLELPNGVVNIENNVFYGSYLESLVIPGTLKYVGSNIVSSCQSLKAIHFEGTKEQWYKLNIKTESHTKVFFYDGPIENHTHNYNNITNGYNWDKRCTTSWGEVHTCKCGDSYVTDKSALGHIDNDHNGYCDNNCGHDFTEGCGHLCHKGGFWYKFCLFFWKLFKIQRECSCGMYHY